MSFLVGRYFIKWKKLGDADAIAENSRLSKFNLKFSEKCVIKI